MISGYISAVTMYTKKLGLQYGALKWGAKHQFFLDEDWSRGSGVDSYWIRIVSQRCYF